MVNDRRSSPDAAVDSLALFRNQRVLSRSERKVRRSLKSRIADAVALVESARKDREPFGLLADISKLLLQMQQSVHADANCRAKLAGGLGRLVTDNYEFSESPLGTRLLELPD